MKIATYIQTALLLLLSSMPAFAKTCFNQAGQVIPCTGTDLPEPGSIALLTIGAAVGAAVWLRNRNK